MRFGPQEERPYDAERLRARFTELGFPQDKDLCFVLNPLFNQAFRLWTEQLESSHKNNMALTDFIKFGDVHHFSLNGHCFLCVVFGKVIVIQTHERSLIHDHEEAGLMVTGITISGNDGEAMAELIGQFENFILDYGLEKLKQATRESLVQACYGYAEAFHPAIVDFYSL